MHGVQQEARAVIDPGGIEEKSKLIQRAMRGMGSGESVMAGASTDLPLFAGMARAGLTGSTLRAGVARVSPPRVKVRPSFSLFQSIQKKGPKGNCSGASKCA